ncbi:calponin-3 isoform X1 [Eurytemora carolleeae]|uniref:calponin-3 isoform X1 n=1 Tax=Eurytemora carolleeae TaxID=1294199 RepID=UPI000C77CD20|nr:calponin-3 isoform X1 [Eurytemora carolleeae]|eukprot:XP_023319516.1 calponin-3-like isoform X1 [Eurytemora affinis]
MAYHGPSYGLSRECHMKSQAKFSVERARECMIWVQEILGKKLGEDGDMKDQTQFANILKDGSVLCELINAIEPGSVKKINTMNAPFKQRENIEMYLKACVAYGLKEQDLFQVNDLYENKNLYMVVDNLYNLGGMTQKNGWTGPVLGVKVASENKRNFDDDVLKAGQSVIGLQYGSNKGASQAGMTPYGASRQIRPEGRYIFR